MIHMSTKIDPFLLVVTVVSVSVVVAMLSCTTAVGFMIDVGGKKGWAPDVNYTVWANDHHFYLQDWLFFRFNKNLYNVLEVNETNYLNCNDHEFISNITRGGRDVFQLKEVRPYYFLSGGGYCYQGMKLAVVVETLTPPPPPPSPANDCSNIVPAATLLLLSIIMAATISINSLTFIQ